MQCLYAKIYKLYYTYLQNQAAKGKTGREGGNERKGKEEKKVEQEKETRQKERTKEQSVEQVCTSEQELPC